MIQDYDVMQEQKILSMSKELTYAEMNGKYINKHKCREKSQREYKQMNYTGSPFLKSKSSLFL